MTEQHNIPSVGKGSNIQLLAFIRAQFAFCLSVKNALVIPPSVRLGEGGADPTPPSVPLRVGRVINPPVGGKSHAREGGAPVGGAGEEGASPSVAGEGKEGEKTGPSGGGSRKGSGPPPAGGEPAPPVEEWRRAYIQRRGRLRGRLCVLDPSMQRILALSQSQLGDTLLFDFCAARSAAPRCMNRTVQSRFALFK